MDKVQALRNIEHAAYDLYSKAMGLRIVLAKKEYSCLINERADEFSSTSANIMKLIAELIADKGFKISFEEPTETASLNKFLDKACAEATERGENWE